VDRDYILHTHSSKSNLASLHAAADEQFVVLKTEIDVSTTAHFLVTSLAGTAARTGAGITGGQRDVP